MNKIQLPQKVSNGIIDKVAVSSNLIMGTTTGLVKVINEDALGFADHNGEQIICIADGHWGHEAAALIVKSWITYVDTFPDSKEQTILHVKHLEKEIFQLFALSHMDENKDFTPEAAFVAINVHNHIMRVVAYGDCRLLVVNARRITFRLKTIATWLGVFSHLAMRKRVSIDKALIFKKIVLNEGDRIVMFTDGVDECIYEQPTIDIDRIAKLASEAPSQAFDAILEEVMAKGAEDNASLVIIRVV